LIRVDGKLRRLGLPPLSATEAQDMIFSLMSDRQREHFGRALELDLSCELKDVARFRVNVFQQRMQVGAAFRLVPAQVATIDQLGLPEILKRLAMLPRGFILITGPTGSGKSTTMAAMIEHLNQNVRRHVITIEDPIEFSFRDRLCTIEQREVEVDTRSFQDALRHIVRQNPDLIMIGEMRDRETIALALTAAEMGSLVMATLHTRSAYQTVDRIIDVFPSEQQQQVRMQLSSSLSAVVSQTLLPLAQGVGRTAALEIMTCTAAVRNAIREGKPQQIPSMMQASAAAGMKLMDKALAELVLQRRVKWNDALLKASDPKQFEEWARPGRER
jgi:twitching motility protein PilT